MRQTRIIMGMPVAVDVLNARDDTIATAVFAYFEDVDRRFSTYRDDSEIHAINTGRLSETRSSPEMQEVLALARKTSDETYGFFDIRRADGSLDPSGIVKGWAIKNAATLASRMGARDFFIDAGGDIQSAGTNAQGAPWRVGIRNPFDNAQIIKVVYPRGQGIATSGNYVRGQHIYNPHARQRPISDIVSLTVVGPDVLEADRFATAAFAMGRDGIAFIESRPGLEGYMVDVDRRGTPTTGFAAQCAP